jgi:hypothetical protein
MSLGEPIWVYDRPPPYYKTVWVLFDVPSVSSVSNRPVIFQGSMQYIDDKPAFYAAGHYEPLPPHWFMVCWRYV